jgi:hypothetical protein
MINGMLRARRSRLGRETSGDVRSCDALLLLHHGLVGCLYMHISRSRVCAMVIAW